MNINSRNVDDPNNGPFIVWFARRRPDNTLETGARLFLIDFVGGFFAFLGAFFSVKTIVQFVPGFCFSVHYHYNGGSGDVEAISVM